MSDLLKFLLRHAIFGLAIAVLVVAGILALDIAGLRGLMLGSDAGILALFMLTFFMGLTFSSAQIAFAVLLLTKTGGSGPGGKRRFDFHHWFAPPAPVAVRIKR